MDGNELIDGWRRHGSKSIWFEKEMDGKGNLWKRKCVEKKMVWYWKNIFNLDRKTQPH